jgi:prepilin-type N-terminal cleavage/methylation domain-containing protein
MRRLAREESGFTLIELLVSASIGLIVLGALLGMVQVAQNTTMRTTNRIDVSQRGRLAMEQLVQGLRSQVCLQADATSAQSTIIAGSDTSVTFFAGVASPNAPAAGGLPKAFAPEKRTYTFSAATGAITQDTYAGTYSATTGLWTFPALPSRKRAILGSAAAPGNAVFHYYAYLDDGTLDEAHPLQTPLVESDLARVAQVQIQFTVKPTGGSTDTRLESSFDDRVTLRLLFPKPKTALQNRTAACVI